MKRIAVELNEASLRKLLESSGVAVDKWGKGEANTVKQLLNELSGGESFLRFLSKGRVARVIRVVKLIINDPEKGTLLEDYQILPDGRRKDRQQTPGGKIGNQETPEEAVKREMDEELHVNEFQYLFTMSASYTEEKVSKSYPNLLTIYEMHPADIHFLEDLGIEDGYNTIDKEDGKRKLFFKWSGKNQTPKS